MKSITKSLNAFTLFFLAVQLHQGASSVITGSVGESVIFLDPTPKESNLVQCNVDHNGIIYSIYPKPNLTNAEWEPSKISEDCSFWLHRITTDDAGEWTIHSIWQINSNHTAEFSDAIQLYIFKKTNLLPTNKFVTDVGHYVTFSFESELKNVTSYILMHYRDDKPAEKFDLLNANQANTGIERYEQRGARIYVNESRFGKWTVKQNYGQYIINSLDFEIKKIQDADTIDKADLSWVHGSSAEIKLSQSSKFIYCKITKPNKQFTIVKNDFCAQQIDKVNQAHEGVWKIEYLIPGKTDPIKKKYNVKVVDSLKAYDIKVSSIKVNSHKVRLLCTISGIASEFCLFTKADDKALTLIPGISNNQYEYYGKGYQYEIGQTTYGDCGMTINYPSYYNYGLWECSLGKFTDPQRANVPLYDADNPNSNIDSPNYIYVKRGDDFVVECPKFAPLNSCEVRHTSKSDLQDITYMAKNEGLKDGICRIPVKSASIDHIGFWSCHLNTVDGSLLNIRNAIYVTVSDSYIYARETEVQVRYSYKPPLVCNLFPTSNDTISNCRWKRHDDLMVYEGTSGYELSFDRTSCTLKIKNDDVEIYGSWTCYLKMRKDTTGEISDVEESAKVYVSSNYDEN